MNRYEHTYWNSNGEAQALYDEMEAAGFKFTKTTEAVFHSYYRFHNDGDLPGWARSRWEYTKTVFFAGGLERTLNDAGEEEFERRVTERIQIEHRRFKRARA